MVYEMSDRELMDVSGGGLLTDSIEVASKTTVLISRYTGPRIGAAIGISAGLTYLATNISNPKYH